MTGTDPQPALFCPHCEYNLTGLSENRCPECGQAFDPAQLAGVLSSQFVKSHRRRHGRSVCRHLLLAAGVFIAWLSLTDAYFGTRDVRYYSGVSVTVFWNSWRIARVAERDSALSGAPAAYASRKVNWLTVVLGILAFLVVHALLLGLVASFLVELVRR